MNVIAIVKGDTVFCVTGTYLAIIAVLCFVGFPRNISTWSCLAFCLFWVFLHRFHVLEETIFWEALDPHFHFPKIRGYGSENLTSCPWWTWGDLFSFYWLVMGSLDFHCIMWQILQKWTLLFYSVVHINRHISCLFSGKGETGKPKFQNCLSYVDGSLWAWSM